MIGFGSDDVEEYHTGQMYLESTDLELVVDGTWDQMVGLRFVNLPIPHGARIISAHAQFTCDEATSDAAQLVLMAEASPNASAFTTGAFNLSSRTPTGAKVDWTVEPWSQIDQASPAQRTPDLSTIIQEVVDQAGWASGNALVIMIDGQGSRVAESYEGAPAAAPLLHVEYRNPCDPNPCLDANRTRCVPTPTSVDCLCDVGYVDEGGTCVHEPEDVTAPGSVTNLATAQVFATSVQLTWTAPGDDGNTGMASGYHLRFSTVPMTASTWVTATEVQDLPLPSVAGTLQSHRVTGLAINTTYSFALTAEDEAGNESGMSNSVSATTLEGQGPLGNQTRIILLHHSTGGVVWNGGVLSWFNAYNSTHGTQHQISELAFPGSGYPWENYPYDYWNIWINHAGSVPYNNQPTLEMLVQDYDVIIWKHCYPVSDMVADSGTPNIASSTKSRQNYELQYQALKDKMHQFPDTRFIVWTGAARVEDATNQDSATRTRDFFQWVKNTWDEPGDNIYIWDFWQLETEGGLYLLPQHASSSTDSHPTHEFAVEVAPLLSQRVMAVIEGNGDSGSLTGE